MKPYRLAVLLLGTLWISCSTSEENTPPVPDPGIETTYDLILTGPANLTSQAMTADAQHASLPNPAIPLSISGEVYLIHRDGNNLIILTNESDCKLSIFVRNENGTEEGYPDVFGESLSCSQTAIALALSQQSVFLSYSMPGSGIKEVQYFLKAMNRSDGVETFPEIELSAQPLKMLVSGGRICILTYDQATGKNGLEVRNSTTGEIITTTDLGSTVLTILKNPTGHVIVSYGNRHLIINPVNLEVLSRVQYLDGREPGFGNSNSLTFDPGGRLYYPIEAGSAQQSSLESLSAVYDFAEHTAYLYYYENFLNQERIAEYQIGSTRTVAFDHHNGLVLIGYEKTGGLNKGGLIRIKPVPEPAFIDQTDLQGVPLQLIVH